MTNPYCTLNRRAKAERIVRVLEDARIAPPLLRLLISQSNPFLFHVEWVARGGRPRKRASDETWELVLGIMEQKGKVNA